MRKALVAPIFRRPVGIFVLTLASLAFAPTTASATNSCTGVAIAINDASKHEYAPLVAKALNANVKPSQVEFLAIMESGAWSAAYVSTPVADDGVLFFEEKNNSKEFKDVWGGWADPSEKPELISWAKELGAPEKLARCFADTVTE